MRVFISLVVGVLCFNVLGYALSPIQNHWESGQVTLHDGRVIEGVLQYDLKENIVILKSQDQMRAFSSHTVRSFTIIGNSPRKYFAVSYHLPGGVRQPLFFQLVFDGKFTLFVREREVNKKTLQFSKLPTSRRADQEKDEGLVLQYYAYMPDGRFQEVTPSRRELCRLLSLEESGVRMLSRYITEEKVDFTRQPDIIQLIDYFLNQKTIADRIISD